LPDSITQLEKQYLTLNYQINIFEKVGDELKQIENEKEQIFHKKFKLIFDKSLRYDNLKQYNVLINRNDVNLKIDPAIINCYKQCPITS